ncbi:MAG: hypothetical protein QOG94_2363 [Solirubrobacteraceae bacterium]|jgi:hypothetical protein|nr:hypothetical protein [Solirubrobacteraceae bacterium]
MADSEFLQRIDAHVARTNELLEADRAAWRSAIGTHRDALADIRLELREMSARGERLTQGSLRVLEDMSDEIRANTRAVLAMLEELKRGGGRAPAGA